MAGIWNTIAFEVAGASGPDVDVQAFAARDIRATQATASRLRPQIVPAGYQAPDGTDVAITGDYEAPYVKVINTETNPVQVSIAGEDGPLDVVLIPQDDDSNAYNFTYQTAAAATNSVKATPGRIYQCYVFNPSGGALTFQLHNVIGAPGAGAVPTITPIELPDDTALFLDFGPNGLFFSIGITMASSSTVATFTSSAGLHMTMLWF